MPKLQITVTDDAGPVVGRLGVHCSPGPQNGERFVHVRIGGLDLSVAGSDEIAAERCQAIASEFHRMALELLRPSVSREERIRALDVARDERRRDREAGRPVHTIADERPGDELQGSAAASAISVALERPRQALDARAHAGEGEDAALEAGASAVGDGSGDPLPAFDPTLEREGAGHRLTGIPDPDPREPVMTKGEIDEAARPSIYPCGCSRLKVEAGLCSIYDESGSERSE